MNDYYVLVSIKGLNLSLIIKEISNAEIPVFELQKVSKKEIRLKTSFDGFYKLKNLRVSKFFSIKEIKRWGLKQNFLRAFKYSGMALGIAFAFICSWFSSQYVTNIEITNKRETHICENGSKCILTEENQNELSNYLTAIGLETGIKVSTVHAMDVERKLVAKFESLSSCTIKTVGTKIQITLHEGKVESPSTSNPLDIIAPENAKIISMNVSRGTPLVKAGDVVKKGQILVKGDNGKSAMASINVTLYYKTGLVYSENQIKMVETGNTKTFSYLECKGVELFKRETYESPFIYYETNKSVTLLNENLFVPINLVKITYSEMQEVEEKIPIEEKRDELEEELRKKFESMMGNTDIGSYSCKYVLTNIADGVYLLDCYIECDKIISNNLNQ